MILGAGLSTVKQVGVTCDSLAKLLSQGFETLLLAFERLLEQLELPLGVDDVAEQGLLTKADLLDILHMADVVGFGGVLVLLVTGLD